VKNYAQFINETASTEHRPEFYESEILGDEDFYKQMEILRMHAPVAFKDLPSLPDLINFICGEAEITKEQLTAVGRVRRNAHLRALVGLLAKECGLASLKEISAIFQRDVTSMSKAITNLEHRLERDVYLQKLYNRVNDFLDRKIAK
jgi:chromosomal replication initiation ATPase DnaA